VLVYDRAVHQGVPEVCQEANFAEPLRFLERCREKGAPCVLASLACVFGEGLGDRILTEDMPARPAGTAGKMLALAEERFAAYERGFVLRVSDPLGIVTGAMEEVAAGRLGFDDRLIEPVSSRVVEFVASRLVTAADPPKVLHLPSRTAMSFSEAMYGVHGEGGWTEPSGGRHSLWPRPGRLGSRLIEGAIGWSDMMLAYTSNDHFVRLALSPSLRGRV